MNAQVKTQTKLRAARPRGRPKAPRHEPDHISKLIEGGLVVLDVVRGAVTRTIGLQYNPDLLAGPAAEPER